VNIGFEAGAADNKAGWASRLAGVVAVCVPSGGGCRRSLGSA